MEERSIQSSTLSSQMNPSESLSPKPYASIFIRWAAYSVDMIVYLVIGFIVGVIFSLIKYKPEGYIINLLSFVLANGYIFFFLKKYGATLGKQFFKVKIIPTQDVELSWSKIFLREVVGKALSSIFALGYITAIFDKRSQTWHDKIAGTVVIQDAPLSKGRKIVAYILAFLIPLAVLGVLAAAVLVAVNPAAQLQRSKDAQLKSQQLQEDAQKRMDEMNKMYDPQNIVETPATSY